MDTKVQKAEAALPASVPIEPATATETPFDSSKDAVLPGLEQAKKSRPEREATMRDYFRVFQYASKWDFLAYAAGFFASIGAGITMPLMNVVFGKSISLAALNHVETCRFVGDFSGFASGSASSISAFRDNVDQLSLYMLGLFIARFALNSINKFSFRMIGIRLSSAIRLHYLQRLFAQSIHVLDSMPPGYATGTITATSNTLQLGISEKLGVFVEYNSLIIAALVVAFTRNWALSLVTCSVVLFIGLTVSILLPFILKFHTRFTKAESKASSVASEAFASIRMIAACGAEKRVGTNYSVFVDEVKKHARSMSPLVALQMGLIFFGVYGAMALAFWYGSKSVVEGRVDNVGDIVVVLFSVMMIIFSLERTANPLIAVGKASVAACQFFTVIDAPLPNKGHLQAPDVSASEDIVFENVTFAYPSRPHVKILDNLSMRLQAGKITAIVGPSGSGKSTIVGLIERWYTLKEQHIIEQAIDVQERKKKQKQGTEEEETEDDLNADSDAGPPVELSGTLSTAGHVLDDIDMKWWRSQIGFVQQEPFLFNETIFTNVANGLIGTEWENESEDSKRNMVKEACTEAFADEFIHKLPKGYDTLVGDSGAKLSGGQRQRIAIARSIVRKPKILILDEATSAIDVRGERIVQAALDKVAQNRTTITIAHRLSTIKKADRIIVLKKGQVAEDGTHESLMAIESGVYAGLVNAQSLSLGDPAEAPTEKIETDEGDNSLEREKSQTASVVAAVGGGKKKQRGLLSGFGLFFFESRRYWWMMALTVLFCACAGAAIPLQAWLFAKSIEVFSLTGNDLLRESEFWSGMWAVLAGGVGIAYFSAFFFSTRVAAAIRRKYQQEYFESLMYQRTSFYDDEDHSQGTMTSRAAGDPSKLEELMGINMASVYIALFSLLGAIVISFSFVWKLALVGCAVIMPILIATSFWRLRYELQFEQMNNAVFAESSKFASESIGAFRTVTALTLEDTICNRFEALCSNHVVTAYKKARWVSILFGFSDSVTIACSALIFWYGSRLLSSGEIGLVSFFVCYMAIMNAGESTGSSLSFGPNAAQAQDAANRILDARETRLFEGGLNGEKDVIPDTQGGVKIEFENLHFKYPSRDVPVFKGLNLTIEKGQFAALVGPSGCGKTSIVSLLERFYELDKGRILCNGKNIADLNVHNYRKYLSLVAQEATLFKGTIRENILLGVNMDTVSEERLHEVCRDASIHDFIVSLPEGYNTNIGSRGVSLSGGQKQRVAIARALIRDPDILLLDEATSSLDSESEKLVQAAFERAGQGRTMVVVAHRLATVQNADVIFVLGEGQLLEQGSHQELLKQKGVYYQMCQSQALDR